MSQYKKCI